MTFEEFLEFRSLLLPDFSKKVLWQYEEIKHMIKTRPDTRFDVEEVWLTDLIPYDENYVDVEKAAEIIAEELRLMGFWTHIYSPGHPHPVISFQWTATRPSFFDRLTYWSAPPGEELNLWRWITCHLSSIGRAAVL